MNLLTRPPSTHLMRKLGLEPDPWQQAVLDTERTRLLLNCCRQSGKSTTVALLALSEALFIADSRVLLLSRSQRQSTELFRIILDFHRRLDFPIKERRNIHELCLTNNSRIVSLPCREDTIRGYAHITLLIIDEAARVPDDLYRAVRPMLAVSNGRLLCLSTPYGKRGFFYDAWAHGGDAWLRVEVPAARVSRIPPEFLEEERLALGDSWYRQEYCCSFEAMEGLVYPDFSRCVVPAGTVVPSGRRVGGLDFGFRNPLAAVWGVIDRDDILWLTGEHYLAGAPLSHHIPRLPRDCYWYADPSGPAEIAELNRAGFNIRPAFNAVRPGLAAVTTRLAANALRIPTGACPNLLREANLYRYDRTTNESESPLGENNHALDALRYLIYTLDIRRDPRRPPGTPAQPAPQPPQQTENWYQRLMNDTSFIRIL